MSEQQRKQMLLGNEDTKSSNKKVVVVLENCPLEIAKVKDVYRLLNVDEHRHFLAKFKRTPENYRPDIVHQCLLTLLDSPLNKAGHLQVFIHTQNHVLIQVNPQIRIPRTYKRFAGLIVQLLHKLHVKAAESNAILMKVIKNPITDHLPSGARKIAMSFHSKQLVKLNDYVPAVLSKTSSTPHGESVVFAVGGYSHGELTLDYVDDLISISQYSLSAANVCAKICNTLEDYWGIL